ncbi:hypothetical protein Y032_0198g1596 [Ancylostoma ceylanicum]|uniref:Uncharacterized protein n=1 Tax=Ancylostoma ceylanicum TaxID=53326 RepID=A0A016SNW3_9BILA|nr:hypothetical protein Y032_0198g1596 [Ancylostoma ceylanicum]
MLFLIVYLRLKPLDFPSLHDVPMEEVLEVTVQHYHFKFWCGITSVHCRAMPGEAMGYAFNMSSFSSGANNPIVLFENNFDLILLLVDKSPIPKPPLL